MRHNFLSNKKACYFLILLPTDWNTIYIHIFGIFQFCVVPWFRKGKLFLLKFSCAFVLDCSWHTKCFLILVSITFYLRNTVSLYVWLFWVFLLVVHCFEYRSSSTSFLKKNTSLSVKSGSNVVYYFLLDDEQNIYNVLTVNYKKEGY